MMKHFLLTPLFGVVFVMASGLFFPQSTLTQASAQNVQIAELPRTLVPVPKFHQSWWKTRHEANCARIAQGNIDFLFIGDSITHAWEEDVKDVWDFFYGNLNYVNMGFRGDRTQHILWRLENAPMEKIQPKAAMLLMGINNLRDKETPENVALGIQACVDKLQALYPNMKILVLDIFVAEGANSPIRPQIATTNVKVRELLRDYKNVQMMNVNDQWINEKGEIPRELMYDLLHPTREGYILWGNRVEPVIAKMLGVEAKEWK